MKSLHCLSLTGLICSSILVNAKCIISKTSSSNVELDEKTTELEERTFELEDECILEDYSNMGMSKFCNGTYKSEKCQNFFKNIPDENDYDIEYRGDILKAKYYSVLAKGICEMDCNIDEYIYLTGVGNDEVKLSDYITESCNSPTCFNYMKEFTNARTRYLLNENHGSSRSTYMALEKERDENKALFEKCNEVDSSDKDKDSDNNTEEKTFELEDECILEDYSYMGMSKFCNGTYKSEKCQNFFKNIPDENDYDIEYRGDILKAKYYSVLAKGICEMDCNIDEYIYLTGVGNDEVKLSDYITESCNSPTCFNYMKEFTNARTRYLLNENHGSSRSTYMALEKERDENKALFEKCNEVDSSDKDKDSDNNTEEKTFELEDECILEDYSYMGMSKFCNGTYKSEKCQNFFKNIPDENDYDIEYRGDILKAKYYSVLAKGICEMDCNIDEYIYLTGVGNDEVKLSDYITESCNSPTCFNYMKEFTNARTRYLLNENHGSSRSTYMALEKERDENKALFEKCNEVDSSDKDKDSDNNTEEKTFELEDECILEDYSYMGMSKFCNGTYKSEKCQNFFKNIPDENDYDIEYRGDILKAKYYSVLAKGICEMDCNIDEYIYLTGVGNDEVKLSDYITESCNSPTCFNYMKEFTNARTRYLLNENHGSSRSTYMALEKERDENKALFEKCNEVDSSDKDKDSDNNTEEKTFELEDECILEDYSYMGMSKFCNGTYKSEKCQNFFKNIPDENDYDIEYRGDILKAKYYSVLAKGICEMDCNIDEYIYLTGVGNDEVKLSDYITESCNSPTCFNYMKEFTNARTRYLLNENHGSSRSTYMALEKERDENKALFEKCNEVDSSDKDKDSDNNTEEKTFELEDECILEDYSYMGMSKFCNGTYKSEKCQNFFKNIPDENDYDIEYRGDILKAKYYSVLAKGICEMDCNIDEYIYLTGVGNDEVKLSDYITESCNSPTCFNYMKEFTNARTRYLLNENHGSSRSTYMALEKERDENKALFEQCSLN